MPTTSHTNFALFQSAFRPLFLLAGVAAATIVPVWLAIHYGILPWPSSGVPLVWHGHEMIYGFAAAALGGFLLTAVANWTATPFLSGSPLMALAGVWVLGRVAMLFSGLLSPWLIALADVLYLPGLMMAVARPLAGADQPNRNRLFLVLLGVLVAGNLLVHGELAGFAPTAQAGIRLGLYGLLTAMAIIGGRIIPSFTINGLRMIRVPFQPTFRPWVERIAVPAVILAGLADAFLPDTLIVAVLGIGAGAIHLLRLSGWGGWKTGPVPLLWVLHFGYGWLGLGLMLRGLAALTPLVPGSAALHALAVGAAGMLILGVMTRAALGHSGRSLVPARAVVIAYGLILVAAVFRVFGPIVWPDWSGPAILISGAAWTLGFAAFVAVYAPILWKARVDGQPG